MRKLTLFFLISICAVPLHAQVLRFAELNTREIEKLDRSKTVVIVPGGVLEEHGPYLPSGSDGIFSNSLADDLATMIAAQRGWVALILPLIPLGAGAANEMGQKYSFPGSCIILPSTLRAIFMDLADQLGAERFQWIVTVHEHGDPAHNRMLDEAGDYFHDTYGGEMINLFGYLWAMDLKDFRTEEQRQEDGLAEHATMTETSLILALKPQLVAPDYKFAAPQTGQSIEELGKIASRKNWPGYFGSPALASAPLGRRAYDQWVTRSTELRTRVANALKCSEADVSNQTVAELLSLIFLLHGTYGSIGDFGTSFASIKKLIGTAIWDEIKPEPEVTQVIQ